MDRPGVSMTLNGVGLPVGTKADSYRKVISVIKSDTNIRGVLISMHKIPVYESAKDLFEVLMSSASEFGEIGCVFQHGESLYGEATDMITVEKHFLKYGMVAIGISILKWMFVFMAVGEQELH